MNIPDCCEDCYFHAIIDEKNTDVRYCFIFDKEFHIDELFDEECHHQLRPDWCDAKSVEVKNGWRESLSGA